jgi:S-adenosylmethionine:tRNA ribosyltransferase-isomerase
MLLSDFDYALPALQIAQHPLGGRSDSRMLLLDRRSGEFADDWIENLPGLLEGNELFVVNNARVIPARLFGKRSRLGVKSGSESTRSVSERGPAQIEVLLTRRISENEWEALVRPGRKLGVGERILFGEGELAAEIIGRGEFGWRRLRLSFTGSMESALDRLGHMPLPPYIDRDDEPSDRERYQTIFASRPGAVAAPTAGLHFTPELVERIQSRGAKMVEVTLDVGLGTFQPIRGERVEDHKIHAETYEISESAATAICEAKRLGRPIVAVGTTVVRALEDSAIKALAQAKEQSSVSVPVIRAGRAEASVFIYPGHKFRVVDRLLTNFHLPRSTLLVLVSAFAGRERVLAAYRHAVGAGYRFYSYGDCMLIR